MSKGSLCNLLALSDDVLLHVFSYLPSPDLLNIIETCQRLAKIARDRSLWKSANLEDLPLNSVQIKRCILPCLHSGTTELHIRGRKLSVRHSSTSKADLITPSIAQKLVLSCPSLHSLHIKETIVDSRKLKLANFEGLKHLKSFSLIGCELVNLPSPAIEGSYFKNSHVFFPCLQTLEVSHCKWINDYDVMVLSKLDSLRKLVLICDLRVGYTIAYLSISFRFGFRNLEDLDMRGTSLQNSDVQSVLQNEKLKSLSIGPIGRVRRLTDLYPGVDDGFNLVMSDPRRKEEPKQQVVVINLDPNGARWTHADDDYLDKMGLQWVKNGLRDHSNHNDANDDNHYFFGKEGNIVSSVASASSADDIKNNSNKRSLVEESDESDEENINHSRKRPRSSPTAAMDSSRLEEIPKTPEETGLDLPDDGLSDIMVNAFRNHCQSLESLSIAGCAITDVGLLELVKNVPSLKRVDVTNTHVTAEGVTIAQNHLPDCCFVFESKPEIIR